MVNKKFVFLISKGLKREPVTVFLAKNINEAIVYFQGYIYMETKGENYKLHRIGEINGTKIEENYCYITGGYEVNKRTESEHQKKEQLKINYEIEKRAKEQESIAKQIEVLFNGRIIN